MCYENTDAKTAGDLKTLYYLDVKPSMAHAAALKQGRYFSLIRVGLGTVPVSVL